MEYLVQVRKDKGAWRTKYSLREGAAVSFPHRNTLTEASFHYACTNIGPHWRKRMVAISDDGTKRVLGSDVYPTIG
jgi:hypothetical protein